MGPAINSKCFLPLSSRRGGWSLKFSEGRDNVSLILHLYVKHLTVCVVYRPVVQSLSCVQLCNPMDWSTPSFHVLHYLLEFPQTHVHWVSDAIQPSHPLSASFLLPLIFASIRVFSNELVLCIRWPKYWNFSFNISPSSEYSGLISFRTDWFELLAVQGTDNSLLQHHSVKASLLGGQPSLWSNSHIGTWLLEKQ